ncbi:hypothetical protein Nmel_004084, partial [Mimus melanotis]
TETRVEVRSDQAPALGADGGSDRRGCHRGLTSSGPSGSWNLCRERERTMSRSGCQRALLRIQRPGPRREGMHSEEKNRVCRGIWSTSTLKWRSKSPELRMHVKS